MTVFKIIIMNLPVLCCDDESGGLGLHVGRLVPRVQGQHMRGSGHHTRYI